MTSPRSPRMQRYADLRGSSGVVAFSSGPDFIDVEFRDGKRYRYTHQVPGRVEVETMKQLAEQGKGLATFINRFVHERFAIRLL